MFLIGGVKLVTDPCSRTWLQRGDEPGFKTGGVQGGTEVSHIRGDGVVTGISNCRGRCWERGCSPTSGDPTVRIGIGLAEDSAITPVWETGQLHIAGRRLHVGLVANIFAGQ